MSWARPPNGVDRSSILYRCTVDIKDSVEKVTSMIVPSQPGRSTYQSSTGIWDNKSRPDSFEYRKKWLLGNKAKWTQIHQPWFRTRKLTISLTQIAAVFGISAYSDGKLVPRYYLLKSNKSTLLHWHTYIFDRRTFHVFQFFFDDLPRNRNIRNGFFPQVFNFCPPSRILDDLIKLILTVSNDARPICHYLFH